MRHESGKWLGAIALVCGFLWAQRGSWAQG